MSRQCRQCGGPMDGKRRDAVFCSRECKSLSRPPRDDAKRAARNDAQRERYKADAEFRARITEQNRRSRLRRLYGLTEAGIDDYDAATHCEVCGEAVPLVVDHDHATGDVRGFLCSNCNTGLGLLKDDRARLHALIHYLDRYEASKP